DAVAYFVAAPLEQNGLWDFLIAMIFDRQPPFRVQDRGKRDGKRRNAAIEKKFFLLFTGVGLHSQRNRRSHSRGVVVVVRVTEWEIRSPIWGKQDRIPKYGSAGACFTESFTIEISRRLDAAGMWI